ncbi:MAG: class I SAM-dependent methyltransferase [Candidatus Uhrbacteria bacterium]|nr:class I SAM-dependent methyltransferase [Candidatus Uhrbacteria bacterium]
MTNSFGKDYIRLVYSRPISEPLPTEKQVDFIVKKLGLKKGMRVLDVGCGNGRHAIEFARRGYRVTGVDPAASLIALARKTSGAQGLDIHFFKKDIRDFSPDQKFDAAIAMFSFGFLNKRDEHEQYLRQVVHLLKKGGSFFLVTSNGTNKLARIAQDAKQNKKTGLLVHRSKSNIGGGVVETSVSSFDLRKLCETISSTWKENASVHVSTTKAYLFLAGEIAEILNRAGLSVTGTWGNFAGKPPADSSSIVIFRARK